MPDAERDVLGAPLPGLLAHQRRLERAGRHVAPRRHERGNFGSETELTLVGKAPHEHRARGGHAGRVPRAAAHAHGAAAPKGQGDAFR